MPVYAVQAGPDGLIKIGMSRGNVFSRIASIQQGIPYQLQVIKIFEEEGRALEQRLHHVLKEHRVRGEWFNPHDDVFAALADPPTAEQVTISKPTSPHEEEIAVLRLQGKTWREVGEALDLSHERVRQIGKDLPYNLQAVTRPKEELDMMTGIEKAIAAAGSEQKLADALGVTQPFIHSSKRKGYLPLERAKPAAELYGIPLIELVRKDIADAMKRA